MIRMAFPLMNGAVIDLGIHERMDDSHPCDTIATCMVVLAFPARCRKRVESSFNLSRHDRSAAGELVSTETGDRSSSSALEASVLMFVGLFGSKLPSVSNCPVPYRYTNACVFMTVQIINGW